MQGWSNLEVDKLDVDLGKSIAEYVEEFCEIKMDLETARQTVSELELAVHALNGLPKAYATLVEYLELSETELTLNINHDATQAHAKGAKVEELGSGGRSSKGGGGREV
jgi:hypothetical protein